MPATKKPSEIAHEGRTDRLLPRRGEAALLALVAILLGSGPSQAATKTWDAGGGDLLWSNVANWNTTGLPAAGDTVEFASSFASGTAIQLNGNRTVSSLSITSSTDFSLNGSILTLSGGGISRAALSGTTVINSDLALGSSGDWSILGGLLEVFGDLSGANRDITISGSGALTIHGVIATASGKINATGSGAVTLTGSNTYTDTTSIAAGSLIIIQNNTALGAVSSGTSIANGGALHLSGNITVGTESLSLFGVGIAETGALRSISGNNSWAGKITLSNSTTTHRINSDSGTLTLSGEVTESGKADNKDLTFGGAGNTTITGNITASAGDMILTKDGSGTLTLAGNNTFRGSVTISQGVLSVATIDNGGITGNLGRATNAASNLVFNGGTLRYTGLTASTDRNYTISSGKIATFEITTNSLTFTGTNLSTSGGLSKTGVGMLVFTSAQTYTGNTTVKAGTLRLSGAGSLASMNYVVGDVGSSGAVLDAMTATGGFIIASGGNLSGIGTVNATTAIQGSISPGNSGPGILSNLGNIDLRAGSIANFEINGAAAGSQYDQLKITGSATLGGVLAATAGYTPAANSLFFIVVNDGTDAVVGRFSNAAVNGGTYTFSGQSFMISYFGNSEGAIPSFTGGNDVVLMAIPEPNTAGLLIAGFLLGFIHRRRAAQEPV